METHELSWLKIIKHHENLIESVVNDSVEIDQHMVEEYHEWIRRNLRHPCYILANKRNDYTYTFEAQRTLSTIPEIRAIAILVHSKTSELATRALAKVPKINPWNCRIFHSRAEALGWLDLQAEQDGPLERDINQPLPLD